jgi:hypothetical protein
LWSLGDNGAPLVAMAPILIVIAPLVTMIYRCYQCITFVADGTNCAINVIFANMNISPLAPILPLSLMDRHCHQW